MGPTWYLYIQCVYLSSIPVPVPDDGPGDFSRFGRCLHSRKKTNTGTDGNRRTVVITGPNFA